MYLTIRLVWHKKLLLMLSGFILAVIALTTTAKLWAQEGLWIAPASGPATQAQNASPSESNTTLLPIQINQNGFLPREVNKHSGDFEFLIINATGEPDLTILLEREHGDRLEILKPQRGRNLKKKVHLGPGIYLLKVTEHPEWHCTLTIMNP